MKFFDSLLSLVAPHECLGCMAEGALLCLDCRRTLKPAVSRCYKCHTPTKHFQTCPDCRQTFPLSSVLPAVSYDGVAKDIIWKLKFGRAQTAAVEIASVISSRLGLKRQLAGQRHKMIMTHAPTATSRVRQRGYDQAATIARALAGHCAVPYSPLLARSGHQKQIGATRVQRSMQLSGAFRAIHATRIRGAHILLVDDVVTTGATLEAAAATLLAAGAKRVDAIVFGQA